MRKLLILPVALILISFLAASTVRAADTVQCYEDSSLTTPVQAQLDLACQRRKFLNPDDPCSLFICPEGSYTNLPGGVGSTPGSEENPAFNLNFFGVFIKLDSERAIAQLIFLGFSTFLGVVAMVLMGYGIYGAYLRAQADDEDKIAKASKILTNAIIGIGLIVMSLVIAQLFASFLGLGSIAEMVDFSGILPGLEENR